MSWLVINADGELCWVCVKEFERQVPVRGLKPIANTKHIQFTV